MIRTPVLVNGGRRISAAKAVPMSEPRSLAIHLTTNIDTGRGLAHIAVTYQESGGERFHAGDLLMPPRFAELLQWMVSQADYFGSSKAEP